MDATPNKTNGENPKVSDVDANRIIQSDIHILRR